MNIENLNEKNKLFLYKNILLLFYLILIIFSSFLLVSHNFLSELIIDSFYINNNNNNKKYLICISGFLFQLMLIFPFNYLIFLFNIEKNLIFYVFLLFFGSLLKLFLEFSLFFIVFGQCLTNNFYYLILIGIKIYENYFNNEKKIFNVFLFCFYFGFSFGFLINFIQFKNYYLNSIEENKNLILSNFFNVFLFILIFFIVIIIFFNEFSKFQISNEKKINFNINNKIIKIIFIFSLKNSIFDVLIFFVQMIFKYFNINDNIILKFGFSLNVFYLIFYLISLKFSLKIENSNFLIFFSICFLFISIYIKNDFLIIIISSILISFSFNLNKKIEILNKNFVKIILISKILNIIFIIIITFIINKIITNNLNKIFIVFLFIFLLILIFFLNKKFNY